MDRSKSTPYMVSSASDSDEEERNKIVKKSNSTKVLRTSLELTGINYNHKLTKFQWSINQEIDNVNARLSDPQIFPDKIKLMYIHRYLVDANILNKRELDVFKFCIKFYKDMHLDIVSPMAMFKEISNDSGIPGFKKKFHLYIYMLIYCTIFINNEECLPSLQDGIHITDGSEFITKGTDEDFFTTLEIYIQNTKSYIVSKGFAYITSLIYLHWLTYQPISIDKD